LAAAAVVLGAAVTAAAAAVDSAVTAQTTRLKESLEAAAAAAAAAAARLCYGYHAGLTRMGCSVRWCACALMLAMAWCGVLAMVGGASRPSGAGKQLQSK
jgi:hypothetical protein